MRVALLRATVLTSAVVWWWDRFLVDAPANNCYDKTYWTNFPFALIFISLYCIGIPFFVGALLWKKRRSLSEIEFALRYGFINGRYTSANYLFEVGFHGQIARRFRNRINFRWLSWPANSASWSPWRCSRA